MATNADRILEIQSLPSRIRNICIMAHVDHGKTTLADSLIAANGIISKRIAGQARYLDSRPDEQLRGITMKSSAISLHFTIVSPDKNEADYLINLVDSPGHVDFASEVSTASRLCDGALVLVDVVEGVCSQTHTVLQQAFDERVSPCLVFNKVDRLISELKMTSNEAYEHMKRLLEQVNAIMATFRSQKLFEDDSKAVDAARQKAVATPDLDKPIEDQLMDMSLMENFKDDEFSPSRGNVLFASAMDGWAFRPDQFANMYAVKLGVNADVLRRTLWGDYFLDSKAKRIVSRKAALKLGLTKPLFVQLVLDNIWSVYEACKQQDREKLEKITKTLGVKAIPRDLRSKESKPFIQNIMGQWLPLSNATLLMVVEQMPNPISAQAVRLKELYTTGERSRSVEDLGSHIRSTGERSHSVEDLGSHIRSCNNNSNIPAIAFISKMIAVPRSELKHSSQDEMADGDILLGMARIYCGVLRVNQQVRVLRPAYDPSKPETGFEVATITGLYLLMGKDLDPIDSVPAGNIFGVTGLGNAMWKCGTISTSEAALPFPIPFMKVAPILRVAIEPKELQQMGILREGLRLLNQSDPSVEVILQENGEQVLATAGELHLERCLRDLKERYAGIEIQVSEPIVPFRETIVKSCSDTPVSLHTPSKHMSVSVYAKPIPLDVMERLSQHREIVKEKSRDKNLNVLIKTEDVEWQSILNSVISFGPRLEDPNILIFSDTINVSDDILRNIINGFQLATGSGPLCHEPLRGVAFFLDRVDIASLDEDASIFASQLVTTMRDACREAFMKCSPRLMLAIYSCDIQASGDVLGRAYGVLSKRRGRVLREYMRDGTTDFVIQALLPVVESLGFPEEIRKRTSGAAHPQLIFYGFEVLDIDPFWTPTTQEELEDIGTTSDRGNIAKKYMDMIRKRKGMIVESKIVEHAEKQRTLMRK